jgi:hypothetical protein
VLLFRLMRMGAGWDVRPDDAIEEFSGPFQFEGVSRKSLDGVLQAPHPTLPEGMTRAPDHPA